MTIQQIHQDFNSDSRLTDLQKGALWENKYAGQPVTWNAEVGSIAEITGGEIYVTLRGDGCGEFFFVAPPGRRSFYHDFSMGDKVIFKGVLPDDRPNLYPLAFRFGGITGRQIEKPGGNTNSSGCFSAIGFAALAGVSGYLLWCVLPS